MLTYNFHRNLSEDFVARIKFLVAPRKRAAVNVEPWCHYTQFGGNHNAVLVVTTIETIEGMYQFITFKKQKHLSHVSVLISPHQKHKRHETLSGNKCSRFNPVLSVHLYTALVQQYEHSYSP